MGATHFRMKTLKHVATEMALHVLAYNLKGDGDPRGAGAAQGDVTGARAWPAPLWPDRWFSHCLAYERRLSHRLCTARPSLGTSNVQVEVVCPASVARRGRLKINPSPPSPLGSHPGQRAIVGVHILARLHEPCAASATRAQILRTKFILGISSLTRARRRRAPGGGGRMRLLHLDCVR